MRLMDTETGNVISGVERISAPLEKFIGLRFRREGRAFFSFDRPTRSGLDMFLVPRPLDIAFLDASMEVIEIQDAVPVGLDPDTWRFYRPGEPYRHVIEVESGLLDTLEVEPGDSFEVLD